MKEKFFKALAKARGTDTMPRMCGRIRSSCAKLAPIHDPSQKNTCCDMTSPYGSQEKIRSSTHASKSLPRIHFFVVAICTDDHISGDGAEAQTKGNFVHAVAVANNRPRGS
jgi:hypothetical protein